MNTFSIIAFPFIVFWIGCSFYTPQSNHLHVTKDGFLNYESFSSDNIIITDTLDSLKTLMEQYSADCYGMEFSFSGYENESEETWYYDTLGILYGYRTNWNMEGTSGDEYYWFDNGKLSYVYVEQYGQTDEPETIFLNNKSNPGLIDIYQTYIDEKEQKRLQFISANIENIQEDDEIIIQIEETKNYGFDFIEKTNITIDKPLFKQLIK